MFNYSVYRKPIKAKVVHGLMYKQFDVQRRQAKRRGIPFLLTYEQWLRWWKRSGHINERGRKQRQYVMARKGDIGPYALGNIKCITAEDNIRKRY